MNKIWLVWKSQRFNYKEKIIVVISDLKLGVYHENEKLILHSNLPQAKKGDGVRRDIKAILSQLLSIQSIKNTVQANGNELHLRFAADGRCTSNKIGTVMAVFNILNEQGHDYDHQYPIALYNGEILKSCSFIENASFLRDAES